MSTSTRIEVSAPQYAGFNYQISDDEIPFMIEEDIVSQTKAIMKSFFDYHNLHSLRDGIEDLHLHIHQNIEPGNTIWVCSHTKSTIEH